MKQMKIILLCCISTLLFGNCHENDIVLTVQVIESGTSSPIPQIDVSVRKRKPAMFWGYKTVDTYSGITNDSGICSLLIDDYDGGDYEYVIDVGMNHLDFGGYTYSRGGPILQKDEIKEIVVVRLTKIPIPNH